MKNRGYTLIELLVVLGIIGVLAMFLFVSYSRSQAKARDARRQADLGTITVSLESFYNDNNRYPKEDEITFGSPFETYMSEVPNDPLFPSKSYCYIPSDDWLSYTLGADYETTMEGIRCTPLDSTPAPTVPPVGGTPAPTSVPTPTATPLLVDCSVCTPLGDNSSCCGDKVFDNQTCTDPQLGALICPVEQCTQESRVWRKIDTGETQGCAENLTTPGYIVDGSCGSLGFTCGQIVTNCNYYDVNCDPGCETCFDNRRYATCICW